MMSKIGWLRKSRKEDEPAKAADKPAKENKAKGKMKKLKEQTVRRQSRQLVDEPSPLAIAKSEADKKLREAERKKEKGLPAFAEFGTMPDDEADWVKVGELTLKPPKSHNEKTVASENVDARPKSREKSADGHTSASDTSADDPDGPQLSSLFQQPQAIHDAQRVAVLTRRGRGNATKSMSMDDGYAFDEPLHNPHPPSPNPARHAHSHSYSVPAADPYYRNYEQSHYAAQPLQYQPTGYYPPNSTPYPPGSWDQPQHAIQPQPTGYPSYTDYPPPGPYSASPYQSYQPLQHQPTGWDNRRASPYPAQHPGYGAYQPPAPYGYPPPQPSYTSPTPQPGYQYDHRAHSPYPQGYQQQHSYQYPAQQSAPQIPLSASPLPWDGAPLTSTPPPIPYSASQHSISTTSSRNYLEPSSQSVHKDRNPQSRSTSPAILSIHSRSSQALRDAPAPSTRPREDSIASRRSVASLAPSQRETNPRRSPLPQPPPKDEPSQRHLAPLTRSKPVTRDRSPSPRRPIPQESKEPEQRYSQYSASEQQRRPLPSPSNDSQTHARKQSGQVEVRSQSRNSTYAQKEAYQASARSSVYEDDQTYERERRKTQYRKKPPPLNDEESTAYSSTRSRPQSRQEYSPPLSSGGDQYSYSERRGRRDTETTSYDTNRYSLYSTSSSITGDEDREEPDSPADRKGQASTASEQPSQGRRQRRTTALSSRPRSAQRNSIYSDHITASADEEDEPESAMENSKPFDSQSQTSTASNIPHRRKTVLIGPRNPRSAPVAKRNRI